MTVCIHKKRRKERLMKKQMATLKSLLVFQNPLSPLFGQTFCFSKPQVIERLGEPRVQRFSRAGPRGRGREWATLGVHPLSWLLSNNRLEEVCSTLTKGTFSSRLLLSNQVKGCSPSVAHSLPLPLGPALLNLSSLSLLVHGVGVMFVFYYKSWPFLSVWSPIWFLAKCAWSGVTYIRHVSSSQVLYFHGFTNPTW